MVNVRWAKARNGYIHHGKTHESVGNFFAVYIYAIKSLIELPSGEYALDVG